MTNEGRKELIRLIELEYERTTQFINGVTATAATIRGWAVTIWLAILGVAFDRSVWALGILASLLGLAFLFLDAYHSVLYAEGALHADALERLSAGYYNAMGRDAGDPDRKLDLDANLEAHRFGLYRNLTLVRLRDLPKARPAIFFTVFYPFLVGVGLLSALVIRLTH